MPTGQEAAVIQRRVAFGLRGIALSGPTREVPLSSIAMVMLSRLLHRCGLRSSQLQFGSIGAIGLCVGLWIRAKTVDQDERGNAERRALFVGLWPPMIWLIGDSIARDQ